MNKYTYSNGGVPRDAYFTPQDTAFKIVEYLLEQYPHWKEKEWFEPSAGAGVFIDAAREHGISASGVDIHPMRADVEQADFLESDIDLTGKIVFGNPPFGRFNAMAVDFVNRSFDLGAEKVAFLLGGNSLGDNHLRRLPFIEKVKAVENRFESGENKKIRINTSVMLFIFEKHESKPEWSHLYDAPYIKQIYLNDAVSDDIVLSFAFKGTFSEFSERASAFEELKRKDQFRYFINEKKGVAKVYRLIDSRDVCFGFIEKLCEFSSMSHRLSPRTINYWLQPENRARIDFNIL